MKSVIKTKAVFVTSCFISFSLLFSCAGTSDLPSEAPDNFEWTENPEPTDILEPDVQQEFSEESENTEANEITDTEENQEDLENTESSDNDETVQDTEENLNDNSSEENTEEPVDSEESPSTEIEEPSEEEENSVSQEFPPLPPIEDPVVYDEVIPEEQEELEDIEPELIPVETETPIPSEELQDLTEIIIDETTETQEQDQDLESQDTEKDEMDVVLEAPENFEDEVQDVEESDDSSDIEITEDEEEPEAPEIIPSRKVTMKNGETLEVEYPGKGWIYLGCTDGSKTLTSSGRKVGSKNTNWTFIARVPGTVLLHFYKEDVLEGRYIDDYLEVTIQSTKGKSSSRIKAPAYSEVVPKKPEPAVKVIPVQETEAEKEVIQKKEISKPESKNLEPEENLPESPETELFTLKDEIYPFQDENSLGKNESETSGKFDESYDLLNAEEYLNLVHAAMEKGINTLDEKSFADCYNNLQVFLSIADKNKDEGFYLLGKLYEDNSKANSKFRNIRKAIEAYEEIKENYPLSSFYDEAEKRIIYLKRFYINIR